MESFLDRLLAQPAGDVAAPATAPEVTGEQAGPGDDDENGRGGPAATVMAAGRPDRSLPRGPAAPRIAVYDTLTSPPRVISVEEGDLPALIASLAEKTYHYCREQGGHVPYTVIGELIENLIHAYFRDVVITILDGGQVIRISDHGPGVSDAERAFLPGFTTATAEQRAFIKGVGSGLPIARESLSFLRGVISVEENLGGGAVFTINLPHGAGAPAPAPPGAARGQADEPADEGAGAAHGARLGWPLGHRPGARCRARDRVPRPRFTGGEAVDIFPRRREASPDRGRDRPPRQHHLDVPPAAIAASSHERAGRPQ